MFYFMKKIVIFIGNIKKESLRYLSLDTMVTDKWNNFGLKGLFFNSNVEKALSSGNLHEVGRLLRNFGDFYYDYDTLQRETRKDVSFSSYEKSAARNLTRRKSLDTPENRRK